MHKLPLKTDLKRYSVQPPHAGSRKTDSSVEDSLNIETGRMIKKKVSKSDDQNNTVVM